MKTAFILIHCLLGSYKVKRSWTFSDELTHLWHAHIIGCLFKLRFKLVKVILAKAFFILFCRRRLKILL